MEGLLLVIVAFVLIVAEAHVPSFGLLGVAGIAALLAGGHFIVEQGGIFGIALDWGFFLGLATATAIPLFFASYVTAKHIRKKAVAGVEGMVGQEAAVVDWDTRKGRVRVQGELWAAHSERDYHFSEGDRVVISAVDDMSLRVHIKE